MTNFGSCVMLIALIVLMSFGITNGQYNEQTWAEASDYLRQTMNDSYPPCENFYKHVCKQFGSNGLNDSNSQFESQQKIVISNLREAINEISPKGFVSMIKSVFKHAPSFEGNVRDFYDGCLKSMRAQFPSQILRRLYNAMGERIGYLPIFGGHGDKPWHVMGTITRELGMQLMVAAPYVWQPQGTSKMVLGIDPIAASTNGVFNASEAASLLRALSKVTGKSISDNKINQLVDKMTAFYNDWDNVSQSDHEAYTLQTSLANLTSSSDSESHSLKSFLKKLFGHSGAADWKAYLDGLLPKDLREKWTEAPSQAFISTNDYNLLIEYGKLLKRHSDETIFTYAFLDSMKSELSAGDRSAELAISTGNEDRCVEFVYTNAPAASARILLKKLGIDAGNLRSEVLLIFDQVLSAFRYLISGADWMDADDKNNILNRANSIRVFPGLPSWITDDDEVNKRTPKFDKSKTLYENEFDLKKTLYEPYYNQLINGIDYDKDPDFAVNAQYYGNMVDLNLGMILPPYFKTSYPLPIKYGGLGFTMAHELFHAFDPIAADQEVDVDEAQNYVLQPNTQGEYDRRRSCLIQQYSKYCNVKEQLCVSGDSTVDDNIGDVEGLKVAYAAYKFVSEVVGGEPPVPGFVDSTGDRVFFVAFARPFCARKNSQAFEQSANSASTPPNVRVDLSIANFPQFAGAYGCAAGSRFAPLKRCSLWGGYNAPISQQSDKKRRR